MTIKLIAHDVEHAFNQQHFGDLKLGSPKELKEADELLFSYIQNNLSLEINGSTLTMNWVGKEVELDESLFIYVEIPNVELPEQITLNNSLLTETFEAQENINHINLGSERLNIALNKEETSKEITLK